ncbi:MAG: arginine--tRNA ligase [Actinomycetota bacterium]
MVIKELTSRLTRYLKSMLGDGHKKVMDSVTLAVPKNKKFGDLSTNAAMVLASLLSRNPLEIAEQIAAHITEKWPEAEDVNVARPGFINFRLKDSFIRAGLEQIISQKGNYGKNSSGKGSRVNLEYVSSNPTGNLHIGHGRWGVLGDVLSSLYMANGYKVTREYYVNDYGSQVKKFVQCAACLYLRHFGRDADYPPDGYPEETVLKAVARIIEEKGREFLSAGGADVDTKRLEPVVVDAMVSEIRETLSSMGVEFDVWFAESSLYEDSNFKKVVDKLKDKDLAYSRDGALWFRSGRFGDDKDRVIIRKDSQPTYFASDIMYLLNKAGRGFDSLIYILGADHHGYVDRLMATCRALGLDGIELDIIIGQLVSLIKGGQPLKMSRRKGKVYTLRDLIGEVGRDAVRYFFADCSFDTPMDFDIDLAKQKSNQNPVFYVQYAHARIESILAKLENSPGLEAVDASGLGLETGTEREIAKLLLFYPDEVYRGCLRNAPYFLTQYLYSLASQFHYFYNHYRIIEGKKVDWGRLGLVLLLKQVLVNGLGLLGISAPRKM